MRYLFSIVHLALSDLWHERILTACLLLSVSAILGPLLLLFGLKSGVIQTLRGRLLKDPATREIYPVDIQSKPFSDDWFTRMSERPDVEFIVPRLDVSGDFTIRFVEGESESSGDGLVSASCDVASVGDPRLLKLGVKAPEERQVVLTRALAEKLKVESGGKVTALVERGGLNSPLESVSTLFTISGLVTEEVSTNRAWLPLDFLVGVRDYREYLAVPELGWPGTEEELAPVFDSLVSVANRNLERIELMEVAMKPPGLADVRPLDAEELLELTGLSASEDGHALSSVLWKPVRNTIPASGIRDLSHRLDEIRATAIVVPIIDPVKVVVRVPAGSPYPLSLRVSVSASSVEESETEDRKKIWSQLISHWQDGLFLDLPASTASENKDRSAHPTVLTVSSPSPLPEGMATMEVEGMAGILELPILVVKKEGLPPSFGLVDAQVGGRIRRSLSEPIIFQKERGMLVRKRDGFRDFRLFATTLEDVAPLVKEFQAEGIPVRHAADRIAWILELDANLARLFWIVATASAGAGFFGLVASFFASVERKQRALGVLQLLGMPKLYLFLFPLFQSVVLSLAAYGLAFFIFRVLSLQINEQFASELHKGELFCSLGRDHALDVLKATLGFGLGASFFAAVHALRIQPSQALRVD